MPAHITHEVFASEVFQHVGVGSLTPYAVLAAQGPDFCLHNHRTKPSGLIFGQLLHTDSYGTFIRHMTGIGQKNGYDANSDFAAYVASFATHAVLDRATHPFINYFSGWASPRHPESDQYYHCHAFLERIIDVFVLKVRGRKDIDGYDFFSHVDCGPELPDVLATAIGEAILATYPEYTNRKNVERRIRNAYLDTRGFYEFTNPPDKDVMWASYSSRNGHKKLPRRLLALFHPSKLPELDYLNGAKAEWNDPGIADEIHNESFFDLYVDALKKGEAVVRGIFSAFNGKLDLEELELLVGNQNLSDGRTKKARRKLEYVKPLPLQAVLQTIYNEIN